MWGTQLEQHHIRWQKTDYKWLYPNEEPLQKNYSEAIEADHLREMKSKSWNESEVIRTSNLEETLGQLFMIF